MKVIIPVAGIGSRLRPHTHTQPKTLVPVAGKPILAHIVDFLIENNLDDFVFVVGYLGKKIEEFITTEYKHKIKVQFINQEPREGIAHAIWTAKDLIQNESELLIVLGDAILNFDLKSFLTSEHSIVGIKKVANPLLFGIVETDPDGFIKKMVEKPKIPKSNLAMAGIYKIKNIPLMMQSIEYLMENHIKTYQEYYLTDALMKMIYEGEAIKSVFVDNWFDCGRKEGLLEANTLLLNTGKYKKKKYEEYSKKNIIIPPVSIGEKCLIENSVIGPNVAIGDHSILKSAIISNSIIGSFSELADVVLKDSIIGNDSAVKGTSQSLNLGDNTEIHFK
jgi:glucose-1-phosphate thymidylyltransferase